MDDKLKVSIESAIKYLQSQQEDNGSFISYTSDTISFKNATASHTSFITSLISSALCNIQDKKSISIRKNTIDYILKQKSDQHSWNYWMRDSIESKRTPYPDDLDDTFCALYAINLYNKKLITGDVLADVVNILTYAELKEGGPYKTWLVDKKANTVWKDIDLAVNANIAYFLSLQDIALPGIDNFIKKSISLKKYISPYYFSEISVLYFIARFYKGKQKQQLITYINAKRNNKGFWSNPLETALSISILLYLQVDPKEVTAGIDYLLLKQNDGSWDAYPFVIEKIKRDTTEYSGSKTLTTAYCLEAIHSYFLIYNKNKGEKQSIDEKEKKYIYDNILIDVNKKLENINPVLYKMRNKLLDKLIIKDTSKQIPLLPYYFYNSLVDTHKKKIDNSFLISLGTANVLGWFAYTVLDDYFDNDLENPIYLSFVTWCLRELTIIYAELFPNNSSFVEYYKSIMNTIDNANTIELQKLRISTEIKKITIDKIKPFTNVTSIANKSIGHSLGPSAILYKLGFSKKTKEFIYLNQFFIHYITAKQLHDDAHDWEKDLYVGHITPINTMLLHAWGKKYKKKTVDLNKDKEKLQTLYWEEVILDVNKVIAHEIAMANKKCNKLTVINKTATITQLLTPLQEAIEKAASERTKMLQFLKKYKV